jgi:hypothetical protein
MEIVSIIISVIALVISAVTVWLTLFSHGKLRMTRPTIVFFGPDGKGGRPKIFLRTLLYSTAKRGQIVENIFVKLRREESAQNFNVWVYGDNPLELARGSGLFISENGVACNHHFLLPMDATNFEFVSGNYILETYVSLASRNPMLLNKISLSVSEQQAADMKLRSAGIYFDWGPDSNHYNSHIEEPPIPPRIY